MLYCITIINPVSAGEIQDLAVDAKGINISLDNVEKIRIIDNNTSKVTLIFDDTKIYNSYKYDFDAITQAIKKTCPFITNIQLVQYSLDPPEARLLIISDVNLNVKINADMGKNLLSLVINSLDLPNITHSDINSYQNSSCIPNFDVENILKLLSENNLASAKSILNSVIANDNSNLWAKYYLSQVFLAENNLDQAEILNREILKNSPNFFDSYFIIAVINDKRGKIDEAINNYHKTLSVNPGHQDSRFRLAIDLMISEKYEQSIDELKKLMVINPSYTPALDNIGLAYLKISNYEQAEKFLKQSIRTDSINNLANIFIQKKQPDIALKLFSLANEINPNNPIILYNLAKVYQIKDDKEKAIEYYKKAIDQDVNMYNSHYNLGLIYSNLGENSKAIAELSKYVELNPTAEDAQTVKKMIEKLQEIN